MKLNEFIQNFAEKHSVQHIDEIEYGVVVAPINSEVYLVTYDEVTE